MPDPPYYVSAHRYTSKSVYHTDRDCRNFPDRYREHDSMETVPDELSHCAYCTGEADTNNMTVQHQELKEMGYEVKPHWDREERGL